MNQNALIAALVQKGIFTKEEGEKLTEYIANSPQSTYLADAIEQVKEFIGVKLLKLEAEVKEESKTVIAKAVGAVKDEVKKVTDKQSQK